MSSPIWHSRRTLLKALGLTAGAVALTACATDAAPSGPGPAGTSSTGDYRLGAADQLRITVFNEPGLTGQFVVGSQGTVAYPLVGDVQAAGLTVAEFTTSLRTKLETYVRTPSVNVEVANYRPFFILGEVQAPGQYPYVPNMTVESAVAIAGGFSPRARKDRVTLTHTDAAGTSRTIVPPGTPINPGDTVLVGERWF